MRKTCMMYKSEDIAICVNITVMPSEIVSSYHWLRLAAQLRELLSLATQLPGCRRIWNRGYWRTNLEQKGKTPWDSSPRAKHNPDRKEKRRPTPFRGLSMSIEYVAAQSQTNWRDPTPKYALPRIPLRWTKLRTLV